MSGRCCLTVYEVSKKIITSNDNVVQCCSYCTCVRRVDLPIPLSSGNCEVQAVIRFLSAEKRNASFVHGVWRECYASLYSL